MKKSKLKKRLKKLEAIVSSSKITLTDPNDENHTVIIEIGKQSDFVVYQNDKTETNDKTLIFTETI